MLYSMLALGRIRHARSLEPKSWLWGELALSAGGTHPKDVLDLGLPPMRRRTDHVADILLGKVWGQDEHGRQVEAPFGQLREENRETPARPRRMDPLRGDILRKPKLFNAEGEHGRVPERRVELSGIDLSQVGEQEGHGASLLDNQSVGVAKEDFVTDMGQRVVVHSTTSSGSGTSLPGHRTRSSVRGAHIETRGFRRLGRGS